jgi:hypothetical protein
METTNWHPIPGTVTVRVPGGPERELHRLFVGYGGGQGRTPMLEAWDEQDRLHIVPLALVKDEEERLRLLEVLEEAEGA